MANIQRLDKFLANQNIGSRKEVSALVRKGRVTVGGIVAEKSDMKIDADKDEIALDGNVIGYSEFVYIMMNKPKGVVSATDDGKCETVVDLVPPELFRRGIFPAGRLDKNTTGLLIITNDGDMAHRMLAPKSHVYKIYEAELDAPVTEADIKAFEEGIKAGEQRFLPASLWLQYENKPHKATVRIREGKFHQVKRMFAACGKTVVELKRCKIGGLELDETLSEGACRYLTQEELELIFSAECTETTRGF